MGILRIGIHQAKLVVRYHGVYPSKFFLSICILEEMKCDRECAGIGFWRGRITGPNARIIGDPF